MDLVAPPLVRSAFALPKRWPLAVVVLSQDGSRVTSRGDFAHWLASNDLHQAASECITRRVPPGYILVWLEVDAPEVAGARFVVFDLRRALLSGAR